MIGQQEHIEAVQHADDQQDPADPHRRRLQLVRVHGLRPVARGFELHREQDVREEDQVVRDVHEHDEALPGAGIRPEHIGRVALAETPDERSQPQGQEHHPGEPDDLQHPPVHEPLSLVTFGRREDHSRDRADEAGDHAHSTATLTAQRSVVFDAELHAREQVVALVERSSGVEQAPRGAAPRPRSPRRLLLEAGQFDAGFARAVPRARAAPASGAS